VTEAVTGRDLVADQLRIATGATLAELGLSAPPRITGHAIEARVYAEDPGSGFLPATGRLLRVEWPDDVRVDTGARAGDDVSDRFDPMIAKVIARGDTRPEALERLRAALKQTIILGVRTNLHFLDWLLDQPVMRAGEVRTDTIAGLELPPAPMPADEDWAAAAAALAPPTADPWSGGWRLNAAAEVRLSADGEARRTMVAPRPSGLVEVADGVAHVAVNGQSIEFRVAPAPTIEEAVRHAASGDAGASVLVAPMPGRVVAVRATPGEPVRTGQVVVVIEAMKMEHAVVAPADGILTGLSVAEGQQVQRGDVVAEIGPAPNG
jgi:acetyl/propionyl-CoA carboxylase alpha subunit